MTKEKRPVGRPKKNPAPETPKNPDCEPATKAYVKCLLRKVLPHSHKQDIKFSMSGIGAFAMWFVTAFTTIGLGTTGGSPLPFGWYPPTGYCLVAAAVLSCVAIDLIASREERTWGYLGDPENAEKIKATLKWEWEPPVCKNKDDCE